MRPQQERQLHFITLPATVDQTAFSNVAGQLVQNAAGQHFKLKTDSYVWDMLTKEQFGPGLRDLHLPLEAPGVGEHTGKFAVIK